MYLPSFTTMDPGDARGLVDAVGSGWLVTVGPEGTPLATLLPILWRDDVVVAHLARANPHWRSMEPDTRALIVVSGPEAYVSPAWYASTAEHGRVVPTWNYSAVHLTGTLTVHDDVEWVRDAVRQLTDRHEGRRAAPWSIDDAPAAYVEGQLRGIVGVELHVERVEAKAKLSQNRSEADRAGVVAGIRAEGPPSAQPVADTMDT